MDCKNLISFNSQDNQFRRSLTGVVDGTRVIRIGAFQDLNELVSVFTITQTMLQLIQTDGSVTIAIEGLEDTLELLDIVWVGLHGDSHQGNLLDLFRLLELFDVTDV